MREEILRALLKEFGGPEGFAKQCIKTFHDLVTAGHYVTASRFLSQFMAHATEPEHKEPWQQ